MWQTRKHVFVRRIKNEAGCLPPSLEIAYFVISNLMQDQPVIGHGPCHLRPQFREPVMLYTKISPPPIQRAINRGRASGSQCNEIKPNQPELPVFYWALFQFPFGISICIRKILSVAAAAAACWVHVGTLCEHNVKDLCMCVMSSFWTPQGMTRLP